MTLIKENKKYSTFRIGALLYIKDLKPNQYGYIILCQQSDSTYTGEFILDIETNQGAL